jgi:hypothetical protein
MIRINLLKKYERRSAKPRKQVPRVVYVLLVAAVVAAGLAVAAVKYVPALMRSAQPKQYTVRQDLVPSTYSKAHVVEDIVREENDTGDKLKRKGLLDLAYNELAPEEKINYEILFGRKVCDLLGSAVPQGINFSTFTARNFDTIEGVSLTASRELITEMLTALRSEKATLMPKPQTRITSSGTGFRFTFAANVEFGLNLTDPMVDLGLGQLTKRDDVPLAAAALARVAKKNGVALTQAPQKMSVEAAGTYRRFHYRILGKASYRDFVRFVRGLQDERIACAFETFTLSALTSSMLKIDAQVVFTTAE